MPSLSSSPSSPMDGYVENSDHIPDDSHEYETFLFTSESVGEGHPDKICDQVSDAILDACLAQDPSSRVAVETAAKTGMIMVLGEISSKAILDLQSIVRSTIKNIGYDDSSKGFDYKTCNVLVAIDQQSRDIADSLVSQSSELQDICAGDQGLMFGYATDETEELMPLTLVLAHRIVQQCSVSRKNDEIPWLLPDCKCQVTVEYEKRLDNRGPSLPKRVHTVVLSAQHLPSISLYEQKQILLENVIKKVIPSMYLDQKTIFHVQPSGKFTIGGPQGDAGLTGRKIIVDTYGGWGAHGGGAFSGKDWSKVDRSGAYACRWVAKSIVHAGIARRCLVQVSYSIGVSSPVSIHVDTYGTSKHSNSRILSIIKKNFDLRPGVLVKELSLDKPIYQATSCYGHFGRPGFPWEVPKKLEE